MSNQTTETRDHTDAADLYEMKYFSRIYHTSPVYGKQLVAAVRYQSDAIALAENAVYSCGTIEVTDVCGHVIFTREF